MNLSNVLTALLFCFCTTNLQAQLSATVSSVNPGCAIANGSATVTAAGATGYTYKWSTGANGVDNNYWQVNDDESGRPAGVCGSAGQNNKTLHITSVAQFASGAAYDAGCLCGILYCPLTNIAASSPDINTSGATNL